MATGGKTQASMQSLPKELPLDFLKAITKDFSDEREVGKGTFGSVYKGILEDGGLVAVKKLGENTSVPRDTIFANEVESIMVLENENIIKLVGYCREAQNKLVQINGRYVTAEITETLLCYEYLSKGGLHLFVESRSIDWNTRFEIIKGICHGLHYLHNSPKRIAHLNLKPQNILLDDNLTPKITDFGFTRMFGQEHARMNTQSDLLSVGYMAPEYLYEGQISTQSDIYSLGLMMMEIITRKNIVPTEEKHARKYIDGVQINWNKEKIISEYPDLDEYGVKQVEDCMKVGLQCVEIDPRKRPSINEIVKKLNAE